MSPIPQMNEQEARELKNRVDEIHNALLGTLDRPGGFIGQQTAFFNRLDLLEGAQAEQGKKLKELSEEVGVIRRWKYYVLGAAAGTGGFSNFIAKWFGGHS